MSADKVCEYAPLVKALIQRAKTPPTGAKNT